MHVVVMLGGNFTIANPEGYDMPGVAKKTGEVLAARSGAQITYLRDPHEAVKGAQVIYTDTWTSMGQEAEAGKRLAAFKGYCVDAALLRLADPGAIVMHCLPAHRGEEITGEVLEGPRSAVFDEAENRLHVQMAVLEKLIEH